MGEFEDKLNSILASPKEMEKIFNLAKELSAGFSADNSDEPSDKHVSASDKFDNQGEPDPKIMSVICRIMREYSHSEDRQKTALINSMKPYLRTERQSELERAAKIARIAHFAKNAISEFSGGEFNL